MDDSDRDELADAWRRLLDAIATEAIERSGALDSPIPAVLADVSTNAVLIDGVGRTREMNMPDRRREYLIPIPVHFDCLWRPDNEPIAKPSFPVAVFKLSTVQDDKAVYRYRETKDY